MNLAEHVQQAVERLGDRLCLDFEGQRFTYRQVLDAAWDAENVIGISISEYDPGRDHRDASLQLLGWLLEWVLLKWYEA